MRRAGFRFGLVSLLLAVTALVAAARALFLVVYMAIAFRLDVDPISQPLSLYVFVEGGGEAFDSAALSLAAAMVALLLGMIRAGVRVRGAPAAYFSAWALVERCVEHAPDHPDHGLELGGLTPEDVFEGWLRHDPLAAPVVQSGLRCLGLALGGCLNLLNPDWVSFFGGLSRSWSRFGPALVESVASHSLPAAFAAARFEASRLEWAGVLGAGGLVLSRTPDI